MFGGCVEETRGVVNLVFSRERAFLVYARKDYKIINVAASRGGCRGGRAELAEKYFRDIKKRL